MNGRTSPLDAAGLDAPVESGPNALTPEIYGRIAGSYRALANSLVRWCANAVMVTALLPYASPIVLPNLDVQLMALATSAAVLVALFIFAPSLLSLCRDDICILGLGLFVLVYVNPRISAVNPEAFLRGCATLALGFPVYFAVRNLYRYMSPRLFIAVVAFYCMALFIQVKFPAVYASSFGRLLSDARWSPEEGRGPNGLTPEPSMMGNMCMLFVVSLYFFHRRYWGRRKWAAGFVITASIAMLIVTKSATGLMLALLVGVTALMNCSLSTRTKTAILSGALALVVFLGGILRSSDARGALVLVSIATNPLLVLQDYGFAGRCVGVFVGLYQIPQAPFGNGDIRIDTEVVSRAFDGDVATFVWPDPAFRDVFVVAIGSRDNLTGVGGMIQRMGIFGVLVALAVIRFIRGFRGHWAVRVFVAGLYLNASMFIPILWFIVGSCVELRNASTRFPLQAFAAPDGGRRDVEKQTPRNHES